jgi:hypothetical protein
VGVSERWQKTAPIPFSSEEAARRCRRVLEADERDLDLAIVTRSGFAWDDHYRLIERVGGALHSDRLDLLWLNQTDPVMTFQVIRDGAPLFSRSATALNDFERKAKQRYYDYQIYLRKRRLAGGI